MVAGEWSDLDVDSFRREAAEWLAEHAGTAPPDYGAIVPEEVLPAARVWQGRLAEAGLAGIHWPRSLGGQGLTPAHTGAWLEECPRAGVPPFLNMVGHVLTAEALLAYGSDEQQASHLPALRTGERLWCQLFSEPDAGSDLASLRTVARRHGDTWVLDGSKTWTSNGHIAEWGICLARTDPDAPAHRGISFFLVEMHSPGITVHPIRQITGAREFDEVHLDSVELPADALLGGEGAGWAVAMSTLTHERTHIGASAVRLGLRADRLLATLGNEKAPPVVRDRVIAHWVAARAAIALGAQQARLGPAAASLMKLAGGGLTVAGARQAVGGAGAAGMLDGPEGQEMLGPWPGRSPVGVPRCRRRSSPSGCSVCRRSPAARCSDHGPC